MEAMQVVLTVAGLAVWALLVVLGVKAAMNKGRSPHWMWFGLHPAGAVFAYIALRFLASSKEQLNLRRSLGEGRTLCTECGKSVGTPAVRPFISLGFRRFDCPECGRRFWYPLTTGLLITYWVMTTVAVAGPIIAFFVEGRISIPGLLFLLVGIAVVQDLMLRKKRRQVEEAYLRASPGGATIS